MGRVVSLMSPCWLLGNDACSGSPDSAPEHNAPSLKSWLQLPALHFSGLKIVTAIINNLAWNTTENLFFILSMFLVGTNALISFLCMVDCSVQERDMNDTAHPAPGLV